MDAASGSIGSSSFEAAVAAALAERLGVQTLAPPQADFLRQALAHYRLDELPGWSPDAFAKLLAEFWTAGQGPAPQVVLWEAPAGDPEGRPLTALASIHPDMRFLVDSVMGVLAAERIEVRAMMHPVVDAPEGVGGGRRSMILAVVPNLGPRAGPLKARLEDTLAQVRAAVQDFPRMQALMRESLNALKAAPLGHATQADRDEEVAFLRWLTDDRFVFLGARAYTYPRTKDGGYRREQPAIDPAQSYGVLRDPARSVLREQSEPSVLSDSPAEFLERLGAVVVTKSNLRSSVHRPGYMDYVGVRRFGPDDRPVGEVRFVGLFTAEAYEASARSLPLIRRKTQQVLERAAAICSAHAQRRLRHIVQTFPRDELFQASVDALYEMALGIVHLLDRPRVRFFTRRDPFDRFVSVLLYIPQDRYGAEAQERAGALLAKAWGGRVSAAYPALADGPLARVHYIIGLDPGAHPEPDPASLEADLAEALRTWDDRLESADRDRDGDGRRDFAGWRFPLGYQDRNDPTEALADLEVIAANGAASQDGLKVRALRRPADPPSRIRLKAYVWGEPALLSDVMPVVEHMGLKAVEEAGYPLSPPTGAPVWVHEYLLEDSRGEAIDLEDVAEPFEAAFVAVWTGQTDDDRFNALVLSLGVTWRQAALIRALAAWRRQSGLDPSQAVQEQALGDHPGVARLILDLFAVRFDPAIRADLQTRAAQAEAVHHEIEAALQTVQSLDADRVLRRLAQTVRAITRTNYYQVDETGAPRSHIAFKIDSRAVPDLPLPKPFREIFVAGPRVEGVHLRFGPVARGGLRWSDRRDDYRTEVLGLVKAQQVKNAVIVPVGSKGGFYPKQLPREGGAAARAEAIEAYKIYLCGLLDLTDNLDAEGQVVHPPGLIIHDEADPYLVVAADKGTATFSDIANDVAVSRGFWLGDAFASGGSAGYDHKAMGITARGAWEAVKRHFREMGKDIQTEPFTAVGVGDMSGDVFGNGMLLSKATRLVAAFDHRHIVIDPDPDPQTSWTERKRLFDLPTSSWADYDRALISEGGGVFPRTAKSIVLNDVIRGVLGAPDAPESVTPAELIRMILTAPVELLYLGGIGTYVKAPGESHADVMDKANDAVRVDATELRCKVVGEGANLGFTQAGRIAFARAGQDEGGGRINTDAIDNSAGVDTSDHEVNIKILLGRAERAGALKGQDRDALLAAMTDEIADHVLAHNYAQTLTLTLQQATAPADLDAHSQFMTVLSARGKLDRRVEGLPSAQAMVEMKTAGAGLTRPELAVLTAYAKLELSAELVAGSAPDDPHFAHALRDYFPDALDPFEAARESHPLRREIIATVLANAMVDMTGATFAERLKAALNIDASLAAIAFEAARRIFRLDEIWDAIDALDLKTPAPVQTRLHLAVAGGLRAQAYWIACKAIGGRSGDDAPSVQSLIDAYQPTADALRDAGPALLSPFEQARREARRADFVEAGAPEDLAAAVAFLTPAAATVEVADLAVALGWPTLASARLFYAVGERLGFERLRAAATALGGGDRFEKMALRRLIGDLVMQQTAVASAAAAGGRSDDPDGAVAEWAAQHRPAVDRALGAIQSIEDAAEGWSFAKLTLATSALRALG